MENKKMTKKETINLLIDVLMGNKEVEDMQIFVDFLVHERELLEKKSSNSGQTKTQKENEITKSDLYLLGLTGTENAEHNRKYLLKHLNLPSYLSTNAMLTALNCLYSLEELKEIIVKL